MIYNGPCLVLSPPKSYFLFPFLQITKKNHNLLYLDDKQQQQIITSVNLCSNPTIWIESERRVMRSSNDMNQDNNPPVTATVPFGNGI